MTIDLIELRQLTHKFLVCLLLLLVRWTVAWHKELVEEHLRVRLLFNIKVRIWEQECESSERIVPRIRLLSRLLLLS